MTRFALTYGLLVLLAGCSGGAGNPSGIWLVQVAYDAGAGVVCDTTFTENFEEGYVPEEEEEDESEWTYEQSTTGSDSLMFVQVETSTPDAGVLIIGGDVLPGTFDGTTWTFVWTDSSGSTDTVEHEDGYKYTETTASASDATVKLTVGKAGAATGDYTASSSSSSEWAESDEWDDDVRDEIGSTGQIPSSSYLVFENQDDDEEAQFNEYEEDDCDGDNCRMSSTTTCAGTNTFTASKTDYEDEDAYAHLMGLD